MCSGCSLTVSYCFSRKNRTQFYYSMLGIPLHFLVLLTSHSPLYVRGEGLGPEQLCQADRSARRALCCSVCTAAPLFCPLRPSRGATPHHCVWQTCNLIPRQQAPASVPVEHWCGMYMCMWVCVCAHFKFWSNLQKAGCLFHHISVFLTRFF